MLTDLLPITALIRRELISSLRQSRFFYMVLTAVVAAGIAVLAFWPGEYPQPWQMKNASEGMFVFLGLTLALGAAVSVPALAGSSIVSEREEQTFELLAMTTAKPWHVLTAKLVNSAGHYLLLVVALAPFAACAFFLVGMNTDVLWRTLMIVSTTALACAAAGVLCSAKLRNPLAAVGVSYLAMLTILGLPMLLLLIVLELLDLARLDPFLTNVGMYIMPLFAFAVALGNGPGSPATSRCVEICSVANIVLTFALILVAHAMVRRNWGMSGRPEPEERIGWRRGVRVVPAPRRSFDAPRNPVYLRERWFEYPMRGWIGSLYIWVPFSLSFLACSLIAIIHAVDGNPNGGDDFAAFIGWHYLQAILLPLLLIALTGNLFTKEIERSNLDALRMTLLRPGEIFRGKIGVSFFVGGAMYAAALAGSWPIWAIQIGRFDSGIMHRAATALMLAECLLVAWIVAGLSSLLTRRMASALVLGFVLSAVVLFGVSLLSAALLENIFWASPVDDRWMGLYSPYVAYAALLDWGGSGKSYWDKPYVVWFLSHGVTAITVLFLWALSRRVFEIRHMQDK